MKKRLDLYFLYEGNVIDTKLKLEEINNNQDKMTILVHEVNEDENEMEAIMESRQSSMKITLESRKVESLPANLSNKFAISNDFVFSLRFRLSVIYNHTASSYSFLRINCKNKKNTNRTFIFEKKRFPHIPRES